MVAASVLPLLTSCVLGDTPSSSLPPSPAEVTVTMTEYQFDYDRPVPAGRVVFRVHNAGKEPHELVLTALPEDFPPIDEQLRGDIRRPIATIAYLLPEPPGGSGAFAVDLTPGRYAMICFVEDEDGMHHGVKGMNSEFKVE